MKITKITAATRDELLKSRQEYDAESKKYQDQKDEGLERWEDTLHEQKTALEKQISDVIGSTSLELRIKVDPWGGIGEDNWAVYVEANENNKFSETVALSWHWSAKIDGRSGEVVKDSGSWSGLKAITPEQISDLEESVRIIKILNNMDWKAILSSPKAHYSEFVSDELNDVIQQRRKDRPNFEGDLETATIEGAIANGNIAFELEQDSYYKGHVGIIPTGITDKFIKGYIFPISYVDEPKDKIIELWAGEPRRSSRANLIKKGGDLVSYEIK